MALSSSSEDKVKRDRGGYFSSCVDSEKGKKF